MRFFVFLTLILGLMSVIHGCGSTAEAPVYSPEDQRAIPRSPRGYTSRAKQQGYYVVARGDTLYSIAWHYSFDYRDLAAWNNISPPYTIYPGQKIVLHHRAAKFEKHPPPAANLPGAAGSAGTKPGREASAKQPATNQLAISWHWPTHGRLITSDSPTLQKGINITGATGQPIYAAAGGDVVYSGSGLLGYGKLIIIKHNDVYLSAYAHNKEILVKEGMRVSSGQKIATMGKDSDHRPLLHFEIRKEGKPVDPLKHLPKQQS